MKKYQVIYADPPWKQPAEPQNLHIKQSPKRDLPYKMMSAKEIASIPVHSISATDSVLFLWTTNRHIEDAYLVARSWGFLPSTLLVWCKKPKGRGLGGTFGLSTEYLLFARRGNLRHKGRWHTTWFEAARHSHSEKPQVGADIIEQVFDGERIELFARRKRMGWDAWGNEVGSDITL